MNASEEIQYPSVIFKVLGGLYAVNSRDILTIMQKPAAERLPEGPAFMQGVFQYRDTAVQMLDLRGFLGLKTIAEESQELLDLLAARRQDHLHWVETLEHSLKSGEPFKLATDPHKCAFGRWYDNFHSDNPTISMALRRIEAPHTKLHQTAVEALKCTDPANCHAMERIETEYMPETLQALDDIKKVVQDGVYREMVLVLGGDSQIGLVVDEILAVAELPPAQALASFQVKRHACVSGVVQDKKSDRLILALDIPQLLAQYRQRVENFSAATG